MTSKSFIDTAEIEVRSGKGGNGMVHFRREKYEPRGGPDGGDGGRGGDVIFQADSSLSTLFSFQRKKHFFAEEGKAGGKSKQTGRSAEALIVKVPEGTIFVDVDNGQVIGDLTEHGQQLVVASGGRGGRGNVHFANSKNRTPRLAEKGEPGVERKLRLELKLIADIGIVGVPNAGKSTLLASLTNAKPKIADYPFTTLEPNLGVAAFDDESTVVMADIPGLIEGAHKGHGLGHEFLRHVQRTRVLIHLLDGMSEDPLIDFGQINAELSLFDSDLAEKKQFVAVNKIDLDEVKLKLPELENAFLKEGVELLAVSAVTGENTRELLGRAIQVLQSLPEKADDVTPIYKAEEDPRQFEVKREENGWRLSGKSIERAAAMTYWEYEQSIRRFQRILESLGVTEVLKEKGVQFGDSVFIGDHELEWQE